MAKITEQQAYEDIRTIGHIADVVRELINKRNLRDAAANGQVLYQKAEKLASALEYLADKAETGV